MYERKILLGFIRVHILYHASKHEGIYGVWLMQELAHHGYSLSSGTIYPILHEMERDNILWSKQVNVRGKLRKIYRTTSLGNKILGNLQRFVGELSREVL